MLADEETGGHRPKVPQPEDCTAGALNPGGLASQPSVLLPPESRVQAKGTAPGFLGGGGQWGALEKSKGPLS